MLQKISVHGFYLTYEDTNTREGVHFLTRELRREEAMVFFNAARLSPRKEAQFEDRYNRQFTIMYKDGSYTLLRRAGS